MQRDQHSFQLGIFNSILGITVSFTLLSGIGSLWIAGQDDLSPAQNRVFETCNTTWNMGIGAIFGLLGSKASELLQSASSNDDDDDDDDNAPEHTA